MNKLTHSFEQGSIRLLKSYSTCYLKFVIYLRAMGLKLSLGMDVDKPIDETLVNQHVGLILSNHQGVFGKVYQIYDYYLWIVVSLEHQMAFDPIHFLFISNFKF